MTKPGQTPKHRVRPTESERYAPARRLYELRAFLNSSGGATVYEVADRLGTSVRTAIRYVETLRRSGEPLYDEMVGKRKVWRLMPTARHQTLTFSTSQMLSLFLSRRVFDFLEGTGFKEDLDDVFAKLEATLKKRETVQHLDRKIYDVNEAPHVYEGRIEHVNEILTALLKEERLLVTVDTQKRGAFQLDPYTLLVYKKGLYLAGWSHAHQAIRTFALDGFKDVEWLKGNKFEYPADYQPEKLYEGAFGLIRGEPVKVKIRFSEKVARYVRRRRWHPTQRVRNVAGGVELTMEVRGTTEIVSWVLGFGQEAEIVEPTELRETVMEEIKGALAKYRRLT